MMYEVAKKMVPQTIIEILKKKMGVIYPIVQNPEKLFEIVYKVKDETWEDTYYAECYKHNKEQHLVVYAPAEFIFKTKEGIVNADSDVIITNYGAYWSKFNQEEFVTWAKPVDMNVLVFDRTNIWIKKARETDYVEGRVLPLIGLWSYHWVHSMMEFLPKLFVAGKAGLLNEPITVLLVENQDSNIIEVVNNFLRSYPNVKIKMARHGVDYVCEELYFQPSPGPSFCDYKFRLDYPFYEPRYVIEMTKSLFVMPFVEKIKDNTPKYDKVLLPRNSKSSSNGRTLLNDDEIYDYFHSLGFVDVEGSELSMEEKADIFYHAKEIVGLTGASLLNLVFCNQARCMVLGNYRFATDPVGYSFYRDCVSKYVYVTGQDDSDDYRSNFYIPLEKIKKVYNDFIKTS